MALADVSTDGLAYVIRTLEPLREIQAYRNAVFALTPDNDADGAAITARLVLIDEVLTKTVPLTTAMALLAPIFGA